jgi:hypothetical protein
MNFVHPQTTTRLLAFAADPFMSTLRATFKQTPTVGKMATTTRTYSRKASSKVERAIHEMKRGKLKSGKSGKKVKSRKQAIAIGLSEARKSGAKVPAR